MDGIDPDYEQLMLLKDLTRTTGALHEAQVTQLRYWPLMLTHAVKCETKYSYEDSKVIFNITKTEGKQPKDLKKRLKLLGKFVQDLLGDEYSILVILKEKNIFQVKGIKNVRRQHSSRDRDGKPGQLAKRGESTNTTRKSAKDV